MSSDYPQVADWIQKNENIIDTLFDASKKEKYLFPVITHTHVHLFDMRMEDVSIMRWAKFLAIASNNDIAEGRVNDSVKKLCMVYKMGMHLRQQPETMDPLVGFDIIALAIDGFDRLAVEGNVTEEYLSDIEKTLAKDRLDWKSDFLRILEWQKLKFKNGLVLYYEVNEKGKIRFRRDPLSELRAKARNIISDSNEPTSKDKSLRAFTYPTYWQKKCNKARTILGWFCLPSNPQKAADILENSFSKYYAMAEDNYNWDKKHKEFSARDIRYARSNIRYVIELISGMQENSFYRLHGLYTRLQTERKGTFLVIILRRYKNKNGKWPENLDEIKSLAPAEILVDPYNGGPFVYKLTDDGFKLYSKGPNNIDEDGQYKDEGPDDWPIWPPRGRKPKT